MASCIDWPGYRVVFGFAGDGGLRARRAAPARRRAVMRDGAVLVADTDNHSDSDGSRRMVNTTVAGSGATGELRAASAVTAAEPRLRGSTGPRTFVLAPDGAILVVDDGNRRVRRISVDARIETVAGGGAEQPSRNEASATEAAPDGPSALAALPDGGFLVGEVIDPARATPDGRINTFAGRGSPPAPRAPHSAGMAVPRHARRRLRVAEGLAFDTGGRGAALWTASAYAGST